MSHRAAFTESPPSSPRRRRCWRPRARLRARATRRWTPSRPSPCTGWTRRWGSAARGWGTWSSRAGVVGMVSALLLQWWTGAVDYPLVIGGKPLFAFEFSIPITFEVTVLLAAFAAVLGMFAAEWPATAVASGVPRGELPARHRRRLSAGDRERRSEVRAAGLRASALASLGATRTEVVEEEAA